MALELPNIYTKLRGDASPLLQTFQQGKSEARAFKADVERTMAGNGGFFGTGKASFADMQRDFDDLRQKAAALKRESDAIAAGNIGGGAGGAGGAGAAGFGGGSNLFNFAAGIGVATAAANVLDNVSREAEKLSLAYSKGDDAVREASADLLKSIPIAGQAGAALARFYDVASGEARYVAEIKAATAAQEEHVKVFGRLREAAAKWGRETRDDIETIRAQIQSLSLSGVAKGMFENSNEQARELARITQQIHDRLNGPEMIAAQQNINHAVADLSRLRQQLASTPEQISVAGGTGAPGQSFANPAFADLQSKVKSQEEAVKNARKALADVRDSIDADGQAMQRAVGDLGAAKEWRLVSDQARTAFAAAKGFAADFVDAMDQTAAQMSRPWGDALEEIRFAVETSGLSDLDKRFAKFKSMLGVSAADIAEFKRHIDELKADQALEEFFGDGEKGPNASKQQRQEPRFAAFTRADSADAFRLTGGRTANDDIPRKQLSVQERSEKSLREISGKLNFKVAKI